MKNIKHTHTICMYIYINLLYSLCVNCVIILCMHIHLYIDILHTHIYMCVFVCVLKLQKILKSEFSDIVGPRKIFKVVTIFLLH